MSEDAKATAAPATEIPDGEWLGEVKQITDAFKQGATDLATAAAHIKSLQEQREQRNRIVDGKATGPVSTKEQIELIGKSYTEAMEESVEPGTLLHEVQRTNDTLMDLHLWHNAKRMLAQRKGFDYDYAGKMARSKAMRVWKGLRQKAAGDFWEIDNAAQGQEWVPNVYSSQSIPFFALPNVVAGAFPRVAIPRGVGTYRFPVISARATIIAKTEFAGASSATQHPQPLYADLTSPQTNYINLDPLNKFAGFTGLSAEVEEDAVISAIATHRQGLVNAHADALDSCIINGDANTFGGTSNDLDGTNRGSIGVGVADSVFFGLRHYCFYSDQLRTGSSTARGTAWTTTTSTILTATNVAAARAACGKFGVQAPSDLRVFVSPASYLNLIQDNLVKTVDVYGPQATIQAGELGRVWGIPIIVSEWVPENLPAAGRASGGTGTTTTVIVTAPSRWLLGIKRDLEITMQPEPSDDVIYLISYLRADFRPAPPLTDHHTHALIDVRTS